MSSRRLPFSNYSRPPKELNMLPKNSLQPIDSWSIRHRSSMGRSSSPARSSSPPRTPYSARESDSFAFIHNSSPTFGYGLDLPPHHRYSEDPAAWPHKLARQAAPYKSTLFHPISDAHYDAFDLPPSSEMEVDELANDSPISLPEIDSESTSDSTPGHESAYFSDSEEDAGLDDTTEDDATTFSFGYSTLRSTCFRVSSERGQWKDDPMALKPSATSNLAAVRRLRQSVPTPSRGLSDSLFVVPSRLVSEPLPITTVEAPASPILTHDHRDGQELSEEAQVQSPSSHSIPLLDSDRPITPEPQTLPEYSSPLPPSSPVLSPVSGCVSSMSRSVSPLSLPPSSPVLMASGSLVDAEDMSGASVDDAPNCDMPVDVEDPSEASASGPVTISVAIPETLDPSLSSSPSTPSSSTAPSSSSQQPSTPGVEKVVAPLLVQALAPQTSTNQLKSATSSVASGSGSSSRALTPDENVAHMNEKQKKSAAKTQIQHDKGKNVAKPPPLTEQDDNSEAGSPSSDAAMSISPAPSVEEETAAKQALPAAPTKKAASSSKRKAEEDAVVSDAAPVPVKKRREDDKSSASRTGGDGVASSSLLKAKPKKKRAANVQSTAKKAVEDSDAEDSGDEEADSLPKPQARTASVKGKKRRSEKESKSTGKSSKRERVAALFALESPQKGAGSGATGTPSLTPEEEALHAELKGMIIECMATSRASSMPVSLVTRTVLEAHPRLKKDKTEKEWRRVMARVLVCGMAGRGSGVFGKVDSSGKDDSDRPLEAQWFYVPELDEDQDRAALIRSMMPRPGKRSVTKQYKQYYYRPLEKISRWDPDDAL